MTTGFNFLAGKPSNYMYLKTTGRSFEVMNHLFHSKKSRHAGGMSVNVCTACNTTYQIPSEFQEHMAVVHQKYMPHVCSLCGKCYGSQSGLCLHMQAHKGKTYVCPACDSNFSRKSTMKRHLRSMHNRDQCSECQGIFRLGEEYNQHVFHCKA